MRSFTVRSPEAMVSVAAGGWEQSTVSSFPLRYWLGRLSGPASDFVCAAARSAASSTSASKGDFCVARFAAPLPVADDIPYFCSLLIWPSFSRAMAAICVLPLAFNRSNNALAASQFFPAK